MEVGLVLLGALLPLVGGLIGAWWESKREHERWLRDRRFEAWSNLIATAMHVTTLERKDVYLRNRQHLTDEEHVLVAASLNASADGLRDVVHAVAQIQSLGPDDMVEAAQTVRKRCHTIGLAKTYPELDAHTQAMEADLGAFVGLAAAKVRTVDSSRSWKSLWRHRATSETSRS